MSDQLELIRELQASEFQRFQPVAKIYSIETRNPRGLRLANLEHSFNVLAASKFVGLPSDFELNDFRKRTAELLHDYLDGTYIKALPGYVQDGLLNSRESDDWFDFAQNGIFISFAVGDRDSLALIADWIQFGMMSDSGTQEVSPGINYLYELVAAILRRESLPKNSTEKLESLFKRKYEHPLATMLHAINSQNAKLFLNAARLHDQKWPGNKNHAILHELVSVEASNLCMLWNYLNEGQLDELNELRCIFIGPKNVA